MDENFEKKRIQGRVMYIFEATLEYLISLLVTGSYLAMLTKQLGISDSLTGILSSFISLGALFQLLSMFIRRKRQKPFIIVMSVFNQLLFMLLYVIPLIGVGKPFKTAGFVVAILSAYLIYNLAHPKKIGWLMSLVNDQHRGSFTANKEIVSLVMGMIFSYGMGTLIDYFAEKNQIRTAYIISAIVIFVLMVLHTVTMLITVEPPVEKQEKTSLTEHIKGVITNKDVVKVSTVFILYNMANYIAVPFFGTYQINELQFNLKFVSALTIIGGIIRISVSKIWGKYADKKSFAAMIEKCLIILALSYICVSVAVPSNGKIMFVFYRVFHSIALGGINSALINLIFDYVTPDKRADSLAICQSAAGVAGFFTTLAVSPLISLIQRNGNKIFGFNIYAQQFVSILGLLITVSTILFVRTVIKKTINDKESALKWNA